MSNPMTMELMRKYRLLLLLKKMMLTNYQYDLRNVQQQLDVVNENIRTNADILAKYVNDEIYVSMQELI